MREREMLARSGVVLVHLVWIKTPICCVRSGNYQRGFMLGNETGEVFSQVRTKIAEAVRQSNGSGSVEEDVEHALRAFCMKKLAAVPWFLSQPAGLTTSYLFFNPLFSNK